ncbi:hypothetical protein [Streptomyces sp. NPDC047028]|uniref:Rv1733c family protein n=1 Tax=Streptomyces sp. NPDC047028 TaxID=3155793 RepID=UPI00340A1F2B
MAKARRTAVWMWRWRRNPLRRRSDMVEAYVVLTAWLLAVAGGLITGVVTADVAAQRYDRQRLDRYEVAAVLTGQAPSAASAQAVGDDEVWTAVRWRDPDGSVRTGRTKVAPFTAAGTPVPVWTDGRGHLVSRPPSRAEEASETASGGALAAMGVGGAVWLAARMVRERLNRRRLGEWDVAWADAATRWGGKTG